MNGKYLYVVLAVGLICIRGTSQSIDALLDKLVAKGILTTQEAQQLKKESATPAEPSKNKMQLSSWLESIKLSGELGFRADYITVEDSSYNDRFRPRYRLRLGAIANLAYDMDIEFRIASGEAGLNPLTSGYTTFSDNAAKKQIWIDRAYLQWRALKQGWFNGTFYIGKMVNPFNWSQMIFDADYTPEGAAAVFTAKLTDIHRINFIGAIFMLDEIALSSHDPYMGAAQVAWQGNWTSNLLSEVKVAVFGISNKEQLDNTNVPNINVGNSRKDSGQLLYNFNPIVIGSSLTYFLNGGRIYPGKMPITVEGEYVNNPAAESKNSGWTAALILGKTAKKGTWAFEYRIYWMEPDAWYEEFMYDDSISYYPATFKGYGRGPGVYGGTNQRGHYLGFSYAITDYLSMAVRLIINRPLYLPVSYDKDNAYHFQADAMLRF